MNDPLDEIVSICTDLRKVHDAMYSAYNRYETPKQCDLFKLTSTLDRLDRVAVWIEKNTPEVRE